MKNNKIKLAFGAFFAVALLSIASFATVFAAEEVTTMATDCAVHFRSSPDMGSNVISVIPGGTSVPVYAMTSAGWYTVKYNNQEGYVYYKYLDFEGDENGDVNDGHYTTMYATCGLNVRNQPNMSGDIITVLNTNDAAEIINKNDGWFKVRVNGVDGYAYGQYLDFGQSGNTGETDAAQSTMNNLTATASLNVRTAPNTSAEVIGYYKKGDTVDVIGQEGEWYQVSYKGQAAYCYGGYLE